MSKIKEYYFKNKNTLDIKLSLYKCDIKKNCKCSKRNCMNGFCYHTTEYKFAKRNIINVFKKVLNILRKKYIYENEIYKYTPHKLSK